MHQGQWGSGYVHTRRSLTPSSALRLATGSDEPGLVVADLIDSAAAATLRQYGWSWWDRRGRLRLWLPQIGLRLDTPTRSYVTGGDGPNPRRPVAGAGGISLALALLVAPSKPPGICEIARDAAMAASTTSSTAVIGRISSRPARPVNEYVGP